MTTQRPWTWTWTWKWARNSRHFLTPFNLKTSFYLTGCGCLPSKTIYRVWRITIFLYLSLFIYIYIYICVCVCVCVYVWVCVCACVCISVGIDRGWNTRSTHTLTTTSFAFSSVGVQGTSELFLVYAYQCPCHSHGQIVCSKWPLDGVCLHYDVSRQRGNITWSDVSCHIRQYCTNNTQMFQSRSTSHPLTLTTQSQWFRTHRHIPRPLEKALYHQR